MSERTLTRLIRFGLDKRVGTAGVLNFSLTSALTAADKAKLVLHVGSDSFAFSDADSNCYHTT